ncbi:MAG: hypothetical protein JWO56_2202 [Acidobacteria bacterium]|nr:hypothetical protein [Acidobacteriota bacterium]
MEDMSVMSDPVGFNGTATVPRWRIVARWITAMAMAVAIGMVLFVRYRGAQLDELNSNHRRIEARLSGAEFAPLDIVRSGSTASASALATLSSLQARLEGDRSVSNLHGLASEELKLGRAREASELLLEAAHLDPNDLAVQSDLAAAELALGRPNDAAERCGRVLERDPSFKPAAFNWALALETLAIRSEAIGGFERYLSLDDSSAWATEVRERLSRLRAPCHRWLSDRDLLTNAAPGSEVETAVVRRYPRSSRQWVQGYLLPRWVADRQPADLAKLRSIGQTLRGLGDPFMLLLTEEAERAPEGLREGYRLFSEAQVAVRARDLALAASRYEEAASRFAEIGSGMEWVCRTYQAAAYQNANQLELAVPILDRIETTIGTDERLRAVRAEEGMIRGLIGLRRGDWNGSLTAFRAAEADARQSGERDLEIDCRLRIAGVLDRVEEPVEAAAYRVEVLRQFDALGPPDDALYSALADATWAALRTGRPYLAMALIRPQREIAERTGDPLYLAESSGKLALAERDMGRLSEVGAHLAEGRRAARAIKSPNLRDRTLADLSYIAGTTEARAQPGRAMSSLATAIGLWERYNLRNRSATAHLVRGNAAFALGDLTAAEADYRAGIAQVESERQQLEPPMRIAYFENAGDLFTRLIELLLREGRTADALSVAESERARGLLDRRAGEPAEIRTSPMTAADILASDSSAAILELALLDSGVAIWLVRGHDYWFARSAQPGAAVEASIEQYLVAVGGRDDAAAEREGRFLYQQLVAPIATHLAPSETVVVVPNGSLQSVPFAALLSPSGRYLIEERAIAVVPSATLFLSQPAGRHPIPTTLLAAAEPFPSGYGGLPGAAEEVRRIGPLYGRGKVSIGSDIGPSQFLEGVSKADAAHFGGHAQLDAAQPDHSALVFESPSGGDPLLLTAAAIAQSHFPSQPLVVLAACSTGRGKVRRTEGADSLARAFLHAGARTVVATLWDIDDSASATLFPSLHRNLRKGLLPSEALRSAQLAMLHGDDQALRSPRFWAGATVIGSL